MTNGSYALALERAPYWNTGAVPVPETTLVTPPPARTDAAMATSTSLRVAGNDAGGVALLFGGKDANGPRGDFWVAWREGYETREVWRWVQPPVDSRVEPVSFRVLPPARSEHSLVIWEYFGQADRKDTLYALVFGGLQAGGVVDNAVWLIRYYHTGLDPGNPPNLRYYSVQLPTTGTPPDARYGHVAAFDPGPFQPGTTIPSRPRMMIFGGRSANGQLADNKVYALDLTTLVWSIVQDGTGAPPARYQARGAFLPVISDEYEGVTKPARWFLSGGEAASGARYQDLWRLSRCNNVAQGCSTFTWNTWTPSGSPAPGARSRHVLLWDYEWRRLLLTGGAFSDGTLHQDTTWLLPVDFADECSGGATPCYSWKPIATAGKSRIAMQGQAAVYYHVPANPRRPEIYDPFTSGPKWTVVDAPHYTKETYPFMFLLPSGNVFQAGRDTRTVHSDTEAHNTNGTQVFRASVSSWGSPIPSAFSGSSAVMYRPGMVIKTSNGQLTSSTIALSANDPENGTWGNTAPVKPMLPRAEPNLVLLPTGDVIAMGGRLKHEDDTQAQPQPQIFGATSGNWTDPLNADPSTRGYHSTALLLPDARVITLGGNTGSSDALQYAAVFEPPYLFEGSSYATRPNITSYSSSLTWGQTTPVGTDRAATITAVSLIRPGATTHAFDQNQRFVPLSFTRDVPNSRLLVTMPATDNDAPPGDYLLFLVDAPSSSGMGVPSMARWIRLEDNVPPDSLPLLAEMEIACNEAWITFQATADDGSIASSGPARSYDFRRLASSATTPPADRETWFASMTTLLDEPAPAVSGTTQEYLCTGLQPNTWYWIALRSKDELGHVSPISAFRVRTFGASVCSDEEFVCVHCSGGGDGNRAREANAVAGLDPVASAESPSLLDGAVPEQDTEDLIPYTAAPGEGGLVEFSLRSAGARSIALDRVRLVAVEHDADDAVFCASGAIVTGRPVPATGAWLDDSVSTPDLAASARPRPLVLESGRTLRVALAEDGAALRNLVVEAERPGRGILSTDEGLTVQVRGTTGDWQLFGHLYPRTARGTLAISGLPGSEVRLVAGGDVHLWGVSELVATATPALVREVRASSAMASSAGDVHAMLLADDDTRVDFTGPDTLNLAFEVPAAGPGHVQSLFVAVQAQVGPRLAVGAGIAAARPEPGALHFALHQSRPNPARGGALIPFDLPAAAAVKLEVFDPQGRRVHRVNARMNAGHHEWNLDRGAARLAPGVYTYRLTAGPNRAQRKLVLLP